MVHGWRFCERGNGSVTHSILWLGTSWKGESKSYLNRRKWRHGWNTEYCHCYFCFWMVEVWKKFRIESSGKIWEWRIRKYAFALWLLSRFEELHCCGTIGETPQAKPTKSRLRSKTQISASPNIYTRIYANVKYFWKQIYVYMYLPNNQPTKS